MELRSLQHLDVDDSVSVEQLADNVRHSLGSPGSSFIDIYPADVRHSLGSPRSSIIDMYPDDVRHSLGSPGSSFIDMYPDELSTVRWTTAAASDFDLDLPLVPDGTASPVLLASASRIFRGGLLLPCEPGSATQEHGNGADVVPSMPQWSNSSSPMFHSAHSILSSCSSAMSDAGSKLGWRQPPVYAGGTSSSPPWKVLPSCWRFLVMLYHKVSAQRQGPRDVAPALGSTSRAIEWRHGNANTAVDDAILYCKKSSGQDVLSD